MSIEVTLTLIVPALRSLRMASEATVRRTTTVRPAGILTYANIKRMCPVGPPPTARNARAVSIRMSPLHTLPAEARQLIGTDATPRRERLAREPITFGTGTIWKVSAVLRPVWPASSPCIALAV